MAAALAALASDFSLARAIDVVRAAGPKRLLLGPTSAPVTMDESLSAGGWGG